MGVQGVLQSVLTNDSYPSNGTRLVADMLSPGQTEDALVTVPSEGNFLVADAAGQLDSAGLTDGSGPSAQVALGGMMTLLGTNVTPVTDDTVGPTSTITAMTPNPAKVTTPVTVNASFSDPTVDGGPNDVTAAELLIDGDVTTLTPGSGTPIATTPTGTGTATGSIVLSSTMLSGARPRASTGSTCEPRTRSATGARSPLPCSTSRVTGRHHVGALGHPVADQRDVRRRAVRHG